MTLVLTHRWEHALLAATIESAKEHCPNCALGRTAIQKLLYFMKVLGVPMRYDFDIHHYGPFCADVMSDVEWLLADEVICDQSELENSSNYKPSQNATELKQLFADRLRENQDVIRAVCNALSDMSPRTLELISTLDFSYRWVRARGGSGPWMLAVVEKFKQIKKEKFRDEEIEKWYGVLVEAALIET